MMILPVLLIFLSGTFARSLREGRSCRLSNGKLGVCASLDKCEIIYQHLLAGNSLDTICGYSHWGNVIVCCPPYKPKPVMVPEWRRQENMIVGDGRGEISRRKCSEYSRYVYTVKYGPFGQAVNRSQCAVKIQPLIVGGTKAKRMEFPHMAAIGFNSEHDSIKWSCAGSIISEKFIFTAAHCTYSAEWGDAAWVRVGDLNLARSDDRAKPVNIRVSDRIRHPEYKPPAQYHDIALLRLETDITFNDWVRPACLHTEPATGTKKVLATGWGKVDWGDENMADDLWKVTLPLINSETCNDMWARSSNHLAVPDGIHGDWSICAGSKGKDTCLGDSGGPLEIFSKREYCMYDIVGVTSVGQFCGSSIPGIYTRVYHYISWIESIVWPRG